jgi:hypothetical protein
MRYLSNINELRGTPVTRQTIGNVYELLDDLFRIPVKTKALPSRGGYRCEASDASTVR